MCAITGSFSQNKLTDLYRLNAYRGELSYSLSSFSFDENKVRLDTMMQDRDRMPEGLITGLTVSAVIASRSDLVYGWKNNANKLEIRNA